jgi:hypothetical protein
MMKNNRNPVFLAGLLFAVPTELGDLRVLVADDSGFRPEKFSVPC